ncbi:MAG: TonB family protein [Bdellovibrionia bacterium]
MDSALSKPSDATVRWALGISVFFHLLLLTSSLFELAPPAPAPTIEIQIVEEPIVIPPPRPVVIPTNTKPNAKGTPRTGVSRNSTVENPQADSVKLGNTLSTAPDTLPSSDEALAPAADDFEISVWPKLQNDIRIPYPREAKSKQIEGAVVMDLYIAGSGEVKKVTLVSGPGYGLNEAAVAAAKDFRFSPARVGENNVPVVIRYSYKFVIKK